MRRTMKIKLAAGWAYGALIVLLALWTLHGFVEALLAACVTAVATWPLYGRFAGRMPARIRESGAPLAFTTLMALFVLAPMLFAFGALVAEGHAMLLELADADRKGVAVPGWLDSLPLAGPWLAERWQAELAHPGALSLWIRRADASALLAWAQSLGHFMARQAYIIGFAILVLFFFYQRGDSLARGLKRELRDRIGVQADAYVDVGVRAVRASANSMLTVGLFVGFASWAAYAIAGAPHAFLWGAITSALSVVPFLGYGAAAALSLQLAMHGATAPALLALSLGSAILFFGDKVLRPGVARNGTHLPFVWVLMGCLGGFEALGLVGLVIGPVSLSLARELWEQRVRALPRAESES
jgi:predicted PurR-regulated permease PerM